GAWPLQVSGNATLEGVEFRYSAEDASGKGRGILHPPVGSEPQSRRTVSQIPQELRATQDSQSRAGRIAVRRGALRRVIVEVLQAAVADASPPPTAAPVGGLVSQFGRLSGGEAQGAGGVQGRSANCRHNHNSFS